MARLAGPVLVSTQPDAAPDPAALRAIWRTAIAHGATHIRVGTAIFGAGK